MFRYLRDPDADGVGVAFTSAALDLGDAAGARDWPVLVAGLGVPCAIVRQVHTAEVVHVGEGDPDASGRLDLTAHEADALVTSRRGVGLAVRVADCVPVLFADAAGTVVGAAHAGRPGLLAGVIAACVGELRRHTQAPLRAWIGPHVCAACYELPPEMAAETTRRLGVPPTMTAWGTPSLDLTAAALAQLAAEGIDSEVVGGCTREDRGLHSHRRDGAASGRLAGIVWLTPTLRRAEAGARGARG